jgi:uncharacterized membrane protein
LGIAGFSHDFGAVRGTSSTVANVFESLGELKLNFFHILVILSSTVFPIFAHIPNPLKTQVKNFNLATHEISKEILERTRKEKESAFEGTKDHSIIGLLSKSLNLLALTLF